ncbi:ABC transporter permease [Actinoallomurus sp. NPDC050550]|uniref:ABC transporter permease n=1 Tax=Actinoallomurus sp. NPDC050550 TaxID=3154937 RepID=UPI003410AB6A
MSTADISQGTDRAAIARETDAPTAETTGRATTAADAPPAGATHAEGTHPTETTRPATTATGTHPGEATDPGNALSARARAAATATGTHTAETTDPAGAQPAGATRPATTTTGTHPGEATDPGNALSAKARAAATATGAHPAEADRPGATATPVRSALGLRLFGSELGLVFRRRRNQSLLLLLGAIPIVVGIALKLSTPRGDDAGPRLITQVAGNGVFLTVGALFFVLPLILPLTISVVAGDSVAGEAGIGTLRYLLAVPAGRTRLLLVKYATTVTFCLAAVATLTATALATGLLLFPVGPVTLLSGSTVSLSAGMVRLLLVALYIAAGVATLASIGLAVSTVTDSPIAAITTTAVLPVVSQVVDAVPQLGSVHPYLFTHWWYSYDDLLRAPIVTDHLTRGLLTFLAYTVVFGSVAWARFTSKDVTC